MEYLILRESTSVKLQIQVQGHLNTGWELYGFMTNCVVSSDVQFYQTMIKKN
jgi:hypothetical protein